MSKQNYFGVAYCGGIVTQNGYQSPRKENLVNTSDYDTYANDPSKIRNNIVNNTDADAYVYTYCTGDECGDPSSVLYVLKSCTSPKMHCTYTPVVKTKIISDNRYIWSKEMAVNHNVNYPGTLITGTVKTSIDNLLNADGISIVTHTNTATTRNQVKIERGDAISQYISEHYPSISIQIDTASNANTNVSTVSGDNFNSVSIPFKSGTATPDGDLSALLSDINGSTTAIAITACCSSSSTEMAAIAKTKMKTLNEHLNLNVPESAMTTGSSSTANSYCTISVRKQILSDYNEFATPGSNNNYRIGSYQNNVPYSSFTNYVTDVDFSFINVQNTLDIPSATTESMFSGCTALTSCNIPAQMRKISRNTFYGCSSLSSYTRNPDFITYIDSYAFRYSGVKNAFIGIYTLLNENAFADCTGLETIVWHTTGSDGTASEDATDWPRLRDYEYQTINNKSGGKIPAKAFSGCTNLKHTHFISDGHCINPYIATANTKYKNTIYIPQGFIVIGESAFEECTSIVNVSLNGIIRIEDRAFYNCNNLANVSGMSTVEYIGTDAFTKNDVVTLYGRLDNVTTIDNFAFHDRTIQGNFVFNLPNATKIGERAFENALIDGNEGFKLTSSNGKEVGDFAFANSTINGDVVVSNGRAEIYSGAFSASTINGDVNIAADDIHDYAFSEATINGDVDIDADDIYHSAFYDVNITGDLYINAYSLQSDSYGAFESATITGDATIIVDQQIEGGAFANALIEGHANITAGTLNSYSFPNTQCYGGCNLTITNNIYSAACDNFVGLTDVEIQYNVDNIGYRAFKNCINLTSVTISYGVETIGNEAFYMCTGLTSIDIPNSVTDIGYSAFTSGSSLTSVDLPNNTDFVTIKDETFRDCTSLLSIVIPDSVTSIGYGAFEYCNSLTSVTIGNSVTNVGGYAFYDCSSLNTIIMRSSQPPSSLGWDSFSTYSTGGTVYVPSGSLATYQSWSDNNNCLQGWNFVEQ